MKRKDVIYKFLDESRKIIRKSGGTLTDENFFAVRHDVASRLFFGKDIRITDVDADIFLSASAAFENARVSGTSAQARRSLIARFAQRTFRLNMEETVKFVGQFAFMETTCISGLNYLAKFPHKKLVKLMLNKDIPSHDFIECLALAGALYTAIPEEERMKKAISKFNKYTSRKEGKVYTYLVQGAKPDGVFRDIGPAIALVAAIKQHPNSRQFDDQLVKLGYKLQ